jgi:capsular polysaccharide biosynthesis protein
MPPAIERLAGAVATPLAHVPAAPGSASLIRFVGGIIDADGRPHVASHLSRRGMILQAPSPAGGERRMLAGRWLYGGIWFEHYGHFLLETLGRAWHLAETAGPVVFHRPARDAAGAVPATLNDWQTELITALLGSPSRLHFIAAPTEFEELVVAETGSVIGERFTAAQAAALATIGGRVAQAGGSVAGPPSRRLWLSRSTLPTGRVVGEREFEAALAAAGFEVMQLQELTLAEQVRAFDEARVVAGFTGTAFHTALLAGRRTAELVHFARFPAHVGQFAICAAAAGYPARFHDCFLGFEPDVEDQAASAVSPAAARAVRQDFAAVWRVLEDLGALPAAARAVPER